MGIRIHQSGVRLEVLLLPQQNKLFQPRHQCFSILCSASYLEIRTNGVVKETIREVGHTLSNCQLLGSHCNQKNNWQRHVRIRLPHHSLSDSL